MGFQYTTNDEEKIIFLPYSSTMWWLCKKGMTSYPSKMTINSYVSALFQRRFSAVSVIVSVLIKFRNSALWYHSNTTKYSMQTLKIYFPKRFVPLLQKLYLIFINGTWYVNLNTFLFCKNSYCVLYTEQKYSCSSKMTNGLLVPSCFFLSSSLHLHLIQ